MNPVSDEFLAAAASAEATQISKVEVWSGPPTVPGWLADLGTVTAGTWTEDETRSPRRTMSLTIQSLGVGLDDLVPNQDTSLLNPLTGNELRIFSGFRYADGTEEFTPGGVYRMTKPAMIDTGDAVTITITGNDRAAEITRRGWTEPYPISGAPTLDSAIHDALDSRMSGLTYNLEATSYQVPPISFGTQLGNGSVDPMADIISLAQGGGMEVFFDANGVVVLRTVPDPTTGLVVAEFTEGGYVLLETTRTLDETQTKNGVIVIGNGAGLAAPIQEAVWVTDPGSPLNPAVFGYVPDYLVSSTITSSAQAIAAGTARLQILLTEYDDTAFSAPSNPALAAGDCITVARTALGLNGSYAASAISNSIDVTQAMAVTNRARRTAG